MWKFWNLPTKNTRCYWLSFYTNLYSKNLFYLIVTTSLCKMKYLIFLLGENSVLLLELGLSFEIFNWVNYVKFLWNFICRTKWVLSIPNIQQDPINNHCGERESFHNSLIFYLACQWDKISGDNSEGCSFPTKNRRSKDSKDPKITWLWVHEIPLLILSNDLKWWMVMPSSSSLSFTNCCFLKFPDYTTLHDSSLWPLATRSLMKNNWIFLLYHSKLFELN